jgi:uracil-DNA glycosylase
MTKLNDLLSKVRKCTLCTDLPLGPRPVLRIKSSAKVLIIGQAPGTKVHETGIPWNDRSGDRLREWLGVDRDTFYDERRIAIMPMGLCYPGVDKNGGDLPPRPECAPTWHPQLWPFLRNVELVLLVGSYAQKRYLPDGRKATMTDTVKAWREYGAKFMPLPHPSWRNTGWLKKNPWFDEDLAPELKARVRFLLKR